MARRRRGWRIWACPVAGLTAAIGLTCVPGLPLGVDRWPAGGAFGVFTWIAWFVSTALAVTLLLLAAALRFGLAVRARLERTGRVSRAAAGFAILALLAFLAADRADRIERHPLVALGLALAALAALRTLALAASPRPDPSPPGPPDPGGPNRRDALRGGDLDPESDTPTGASRWATVLPTGMAIVLVLLVLLGTTVRWLGPGLGLGKTVQRPVPVFWSETAFYEYDARQRAGADTSDYLRPPTPPASDRAVLPAGAKLSVQGWVDNGLEVRVESDPSGKLTGEWGYVHAIDYFR